jgi:hypothetical protein
LQDRQSYPEVEAVFKDAAEREGSILDVKYFRPVGE